MVLFQVVPEKIKIIYVIHWRDLVGFLGVADFLKFKSKKIWGLTCLALIFNMCSTVIKKSRLWNDYRQLTRFALNQPEKPINCGTKATDVPYEFQLANNANALNILVHLQLLCAQRGNELV